jgi:hypothetical protein
MLAHQDDYLPEALAAAKEEVSKRNLAPERVAQLELETRLPVMETLQEAFKRGVRLRRFEPSELPGEFQARLFEVCRVDPNVAAMWLVWLLSPNGVSSELCASLVLNRRDESAIRDFVERANALGGPRFVALIATGIPRAKPFYRRGIELRPGMLKNDRQNEGDHGDIPG